MFVNVTRDGKKLRFQVSDWSTQLDPLLLLVTTDSEPIPTFDSVTAIIALWSIYFFHKL